MWTVDLAREQTPTLDHLRALCRLSLDSGYNGLGLYLEHRFAYASAPWAQGTACVTPDHIRQLRAEFPDLQLVPFLNLLGHMEGFLYTERGHRFAEERFKGMQACATNGEFVRLAEGLVDDAIAAFDSEIVHIGGDETWQLGACPSCRDAGQTLDAKDPKAGVYRTHFGPLAERVLKAGRRPAVWADMLLEHPRALEAIPHETLILDWQYFKGPGETSKLIVDQGFEVVCCPSILTYDATWMHLPQSQSNIADHIREANELNSAGICVTTWECGLFGNYETLFPAIKEAGRAIARGGQPDLLAGYGAESPAHAEWAELMGSELQRAGGLFAFDGMRSSLKSRLLLYSNPFLAWMHHAEELCGSVGDAALKTIDQAIACAPNGAMRGVSEFARGAIDFVRFAEQAHQAYAQGLPGLAVSALAPTRQTFDNLAKIARATQLNSGGSLADIERCRIAKEHVERVIQRIRNYGDGSLGYLPSFQMLSHPKFVPHDQAGWWLVNDWANE